MTRCPDASKLLRQIDRSPGSSRPSKRRDAMKKGNGPVERRPSLARVLCCVASRRVLVCARGPRVGEQGRVNSDRNVNSVFCAIRKEVMK